MKRPISLSLLVAAIAAVGVGAVVFTQAKASDYPPAVQHLIDQGVEVEATFDAPGNLTGYAGRAGGQPIVLYATEDREHVLIGNMLNAEGHNLTSAQLDRYLPEPDIDSAWAELEQATWIAEGGEQPQRIVYVFDDPNCPFCKALWEASQAYLDDDVQVRHIMVAMVHPTSMGKAARMLAADDQHAAFVEHQENGSQPLAEIPANVRAEIEANNALMQSLGAHATPAMFYKDPDGKVRQIMGVPDATKLTEEVFQKQPRG